jgi:hypothetical protein
MPTSSIAVFIINYHFASPEMEATRDEAELAPCHRVLFTSQNRFDRCKPVNADLTANNAKLSGQGAVRMEALVAR